MVFTYLEKNYDIIIDKKKNKNIYFRVKDDLKLYVTCNYLISDKKILNIIEDNRESIEKLYEKVLSKKEKHDGFLYLGKKYDIVYTNNKNIELGLNKVFISRDFDIDKWYKKQASILFKEKLDECYKKYTRNIPYPKLKIRKMTSRWGVCNYKDIIVTLNLELIKYDIICLEYVIYHELSHLIEPNHQKNFWYLVEENYSDYKKAKKILKEN